jgi:hypothetical protein
MTDIERELLVAIALMLSKTASPAGRSKLDEILDRLAAERLAEALKELN